MLLNDKLAMSLEDSKTKTSTTPNVMLGTLRCVIRRNIILLITDDIVAVRMCLPFYKLE